MILESIKTVLKEFKLNKLRTFLTMLGIIIGIFSITIIISLSNSIATYMTDEINNLDVESMQIQFFNQNSYELELINNELLNYTNNNDNVLGMYKTNYFEFKELDELLLDDNQEYMTTRGNNLYIGIDENFESLNPKSFTADKLLYGRYLDKKDILNKMPYIVIREDCAYTLFHTKDVVGKKLTINNNELEIIGVTKTVEENAIVYNELSAIYASYYYIEDVMNINNTLNTTVYNIKVKNKENSKEIESDIRKLLKTYGEDNYNIYVLDISMALEEINNIIDVVKIVFAGIASLSIIVGGIGIMNIMLVSVSERIKETGIRMALGAKNTDIVIQFLIEGIVLTILSGLIGIFLAFITESIANSALATTQYNLRIVIDIYTLIKTILACGILGIIFGIYPALKAGKLDPVEALKYE